MFRRRQIVVGALAAAAVAGGAATAAAARPSAPTPGLLSFDGGTGRFGAAHGWFHAHALPNGDLHITAIINGDS